MTSVGTAVNCSLMTTGDSFSMRIFSSFPIRVTWAKLERVPEGVYGPGEAFHFVPKYLLIAPYDD